eukprot:763583-Hanusia_phi.AAC.5
MGSGIFFCIAKRPVAPDGFSNTHDQHGPNRTIGLLSSAISSSFLAVLFLSVLGKLSYPITFSLFRLLVPSSVSYPLPSRLVFGSIVAKTPVPPHPSFQENSPHPSMETCPTPGSRTPTPNSL